MHLQIKLIVYLVSVNHTKICSWNQTVLSNEGKVSSSRKQREPLVRGSNSRLTLILLGFTILTLIYIISLHLLFLYHIFTLIVIYHIFTLIVIISYLYTCCSYIISLNLLFLYHIFTLVVLI